MGTFEFGNLTVDTNKTIKKVNALSTRCFSKSTGSAGHILILTSTVLNQNLSTAFQKYVTKTFSDFQVDCISLTASKLTNDEITKIGVTKFFKENRQESFKDYVKSGSTIVITLGRALYGLNLATDIDVEDFYDNILGKSYYYSPEVQTLVFPVDNLEDIFVYNEKKYLYEMADSFRSKFAATQFENIKTNYNTLKSSAVAFRPVILRINSEQEATDLFHRYSTPCKVSWDTETSGFDFIEDRLGCITISFDGKTGYFIPWRFVNIEEFNKFLSNKFQIGQNLKFDCKFARQAGATNAKVSSDTLILGQVINEYRSNGLKSLAYYYSNYGGYDKELDEYIEKYSPPTYLDIPEKILSKYATMDAIVTYQVHEAMQKQLDKMDAAYPPPEEGWWTFRNYYQNIRIPAVNAFIDIEMEGIFVDMAIWDKNSKIAMDKITSITEDLRVRLKIDEFLNAPKIELAVTFGVEDETEEDEVDKMYNNPYYKCINSPTQLGRLLEWLQWEDFGRGKNNAYISADIQLTMWEQKGHKEATALKEFRAYRTLLKTFLGAPGTTEGWRKYIRKHPDGSYRVHPTYRVMGAESGRNTCDSPNWQQIPSSSIGCDLVKEIITVPDKEQYYLATLDYSSLQIRLAAIDSLDPYLCKVYREDPEADLHSVTAYEVFCKGRDFKVEEITLTDGDKSVTLFPHEKVNVIRNGVVQTLAAKDVIESDSLA